MTIRLHISLSLLILVGAGLLLSSCSGARKSKSVGLWSPEMPQEIVGDAPTLDLEYVERAVHLEANRVRRQEGLEALDWSDKLAHVAREHSKDMARKGYFAHVNKEGQDATARAEKVGLGSVHKTEHYIVEGIGENLFATHRFSEYAVTMASSGERSYQVNWKDQDFIATEAVDGWMNSRPHRVNLLSPAYTRQGIGVALGSNGTLFVTQNMD